MRAVDFSEATLARCWREIKPRLRALQDGPDPAANVVIGHPVELSLPADMASVHDLPGLLVDQQQFQILGGRLAEGAHGVIGRTVSVEPLVPMLPVVPLHPRGPGRIERVQLAVVEVLQHEVALDEAELILDPPLRPGLPSVVQLNAQAPREERNPNGGPNRSCASRSKAECPCVARLRWTGHLRSSGVRAR